MSAAAGTLAGKRALVTGGAKNIGRAIALELARAGADVGITFHSSGQQAESTAAELRACSVRAWSGSCDVADAVDIERASAQCIDTFGGLDILINNAGVFHTAPLEKISVAQWDAMFAVNTRAPFLMAKACLPALRAARGSIVNIGSLGGQRAWPTHGHYCASKAALHSLTETMAKAWAPEVRVNCVAPGVVVTGEDNQRYDHFASKTPLQRNATVDEIAKAVLFLETEPNFITGQILRVDGGLGL